MNIQEAMRKGKELYELPRGTLLKCVEDLGKLDFQTTEKLSFSYEYTDELPCLDKFPRLKKLHINRNLSAKELDELDFKTLEELEVVFDKSFSDVLIDAPNLKKLYIRINDNEGDQLSLFKHSDIIVDISNCNQLEKLKLNHCTGCKFIIGNLSFLKSFSCNDFKYYDFEILKYMPHLNELSITSSKIKNIDFILQCKNLEKLDLCYNEIENVDVICKLVKLKALRIYRNPIKDYDILYNLPLRELLITDKDHEFDFFKGSIQIQATSMAYSFLMRVRNPDNKTPEYVKNTYSKQSDEEIFGKLFARIVKDEIERYTTKENRPSGKVYLDENELNGYILTEYPFLTNFL